MSVVSLVIGSTLAVSAGELQWRRGGPKSKSATASKATAAKSASKQYRRDSAVQTVAYEDEVTGPSFAAHESEPGAATMRSIVVRESTESEGGHIRAAQLQWGQSTDNRYEDTTRTPFGSGAEPTNDQLEVEVEEGFAEEELTSPPADLPEDMLTSPTEEELRLPQDDSAGGDSDVQIKRRQTELEPNAELPTLGPSGTDAFGIGQDEPDADVDPRLLAQEEAKADEDCEAAFAKLRASRLHDVNLNIAVTGTQGEDFPFECSIDEGQWHTGRHWCDTTYMWKASALCHKPLYFEDEALERYGHSWGPCLDPIVSGAHFFCKLPVLPYCMGVQPPTECVYALGHYRPGNCAPYMIDPVPLSCRGALFQAGAVTGAAAALP